VVGALAARGSAGVLEGLLGVAGWPGNEVIGTSVVAVFAVLAAGAGFPILRTLASRESPLRLLRNP
jgi:hypothetical protein